MTQDELDSLEVGTSLIFSPPNPTKFLVVNKILMCGSIYIVATNEQHGLIILVDQPIGWSVYVGAEDNVQQPANIPYPREEADRMKFGRDVHQRIEEMENNRQDAMAAMRKTMMLEAAVHLNEVRDVIIRSKRAVPGSNEDLLLRQEFQDKMCRTIFSMLHSEMDRDILHVLAQG